MKKPNQADRQESVSDLEEAIGAAQSYQQAVNELFQAMQIDTDVKPAEEVDYPNIDYPIKPLS